MLKSDRSVWDGHATYRLDIESQCASFFRCPKSDGDDSRAPTMCLVCGTMLCSQSYCCQTEFEGATMGAATEHAYKCGGGAGIFLR